MRALHHQHTCLGNLRSQHEEETVEFSQGSQDQNVALASSVGWLEQVNIGTLDMYYELCYLQDERTLATDRSPSRVSSQAILVALMVPLGLYEARDNDSNDHFQARSTKHRQYHCVDRICRLFRSISLL